MRYTILLALLFIAPCTLGQTQGQPIKKADNPYFPFIVSLPTIEYDITINLNDPKVIAIYKPIFLKHHLPFTPDSWENIVTDIMDNSDSVMEHQIITSAQKYVLRIGTGSAQYQQAFLQHTLPIFTNTSKLEAFMDEN